MFETIKSADADPILGLLEAFRKDPRESKVNLGIGVFKDQFGETPILKAFKQAEAEILATENSKSYLAMSGNESFNIATQHLLLGENSSVIANKRIRTAQSLGGTGALRIAAEFIKRFTQAKTVWISAPSWPNHESIFKAVGIEVKHYRYYDKKNHSLAWESMIEDLSQAKANDVVILHGCCHNPTGIDPTFSQWKQLAELTLEKGCLPLFDFAYQGFARSLEEDAEGLRLFAEHHKEILIASSYSKNFGAYKERVGAFSLIAGTAEVAERAFSQIKIIIRTLYSNPPSHGATAVAAVLQNSDLKKSWVEELTSMNERISFIRQKFVETLKKIGVTQDFDFILLQNGMFSMTGLTPEQVDLLKEKYGIYIVRSGRVNFAAITDENIDYICRSIAQVI